MADWQTEQLNTVSCVAGVEQTFTIAVPASGRYVLENIGVECRVGLWGSAIPVKGVNGLLGICGTNVKGTHNNTPAALLSITVFPLQSGLTTVRLRKFAFLDNWWALFSLYKNTCPITGG